MLLALSATRLIPPSLPPSLPPSPLHSLVLEEFHKRDYPPVIVIMGPLPWLAPNIISNDATLIAEMLLLGNKVRPPSLLPSLPPPSLYTNEN